jgi:PEP-CTERM motif-containing protein
VTISGQFNIILSGTRKLFRTLPLRSAPVVFKFMEKLGKRMSKPRVLTLAVSVVFLLTLASSVFADPINTPPGLAKLSLAGDDSLTVPDIVKGETGYLFAEHFANNSGKHLGFSVAAFHAGPKFGLTNPRNPLSSTPTQNPEPTGMLLLGTGLAAGAAFARRWNRKRKA